MQKYIVVICLMMVGFVGVTSGQTQSKEFYELRVYEMRMGPALSNLEKFFSTALIPALNRNGVKKVGVFREMGKSEPPKVYLLIPYPSIEDYGKVLQALDRDAEFQQARKEYDQLPADRPVYDRFESSLMIAFDGLPQMIVPENKPRIFELRTYEGYSEDAVRRKVKMFNEGEFDIFFRTKLNPVFFGEVISGKGLPCLTYMITFSNMEERDANWRAFGSDPAWQKISKDPQYANTVSKIIRVFLEPTSYSQL